jgi:hypothetical protein
LQPSSAAEFNILLLKASENGNSATVSVGKLKSFSALKPIFVEFAKFALFANHFAFVYHSSQQKRDFLSIFLIHLSRILCRSILMLYQWFSMFLSWRYAKQN